MPKIGRHRAEVVVTDDERTTLARLTKRARVNCAWRFAHGSCCDVDWVAGRNGDLGSRRMRLSGARSASQGLATEFHFFGDDDGVRHWRVLMDTGDRQAAETCVDLNMSSSRVVWARPRNHARRAGSD
jgi:hypothetical protein